MTKVILCICFFLFQSLNIFAEEIKMTSLRLGHSLSIHPLAGSAASRFENKLGDSGVFVHNSKITLNFTKIDGEQYSRSLLMYARDCVNSPVYGFGFAHGHQSNNQQFGFIFGGYFMDRHPWESRELPQMWINVN